MSTTQSWQLLPKKPTSEMLKAGFPMRSTENALFDYQQLLKSAPTKEAQMDVELIKLVLMGMEVVEDFLPNIANCALQDYGRLNQFMISARMIKEANPK